MGSKARESTDAMKDRPLREEIYTDVPAAVDTYLLQCRCSHDVYESGSRQVQDHVTQVAGRRRAPRFISDGAIFWSVLRSESL